MKVAVAICTWNRARLLDQTLAAMCQLTIPPGVTWELLVVNNNCTDETDAVIARYASRLPIRRLFEPTPGLSHARNCAVAIAEGDLLLWTDDDVLVDPNWLAEYARAAAEHPGMSFFGGTVDPWFQSKPPRWIEQNIAVFASPFAIRQPGLAIRPMRADEGPFGASMGFRMPVAKQFAFNPKLGRVKDSLLSDDDADVIQRLRAAGHEGLWVGTARVRHYIGPDRVNAMYLRKWFFDNGRSQVRMDGIDGGFRWLGDTPLFAVKALWFARARRLLLWPWKNRTWARAYRDVPFYRGKIVEARAFRRLARSNQGVQPKAFPTG
ncbi:MAG TPA: glycosyltransferase [Tepidisphaeraceae bacterium]